MKKLSIIFGVFLLSFSLFSNQSSAQFSDVDNQNDFAEAIELLQEKGVIEGYEDGTYRPNHRINRAEFLTLLLRSTGEEFTGKDCFEDVKNEWFAPAICTAKEMEIIKGYGDGTFQPARKINVAEASKIIDKVLEVKTDDNLSENWYQKFLVALEDKKAIPDSIFSAEQEINRGEMAEIVWRIKEEITEKPTQKYDVISADLPKFASCEMMGKEMKKAEKSQNYYPQTMWRGGEMMLDSMEMAAPSMAKGIESEGASDYSETNVQVAGVDEADMVKTDGEYIYYLSGKNIHIVKAYPAENMKELSTIELPKNFNSRDILLRENQLIVLGNVWEEYKYEFDEPTVLEDEMPGKRMIMPPYHNRNKTGVLVYDIADKTAPKIAEKLTFDGNYQTVRRIGNQLYLVTTEHIWDYQVRPMEFLPTFARGNSAKKTLVDCGEVRYIPGHSLRQYSSFISVDLDDLQDDPEQEIILGGNSNTIYMSTKNAYITTPFYETGRFHDWDWTQDRTKTMIFKFSLNDGDIEFEKKGRVTGNLLNQFSLDESRGNLRVATTINGQSMSNNVFILDENMEQVGEITDIAPGEKIYSTRFIGNKLYMVTFRTIDPLFVIDLQDAKNPRILGKLKIPGYSNYLHPYDEDHLIGFGKDTEESKDKSFAWYQGMKLALFDVSDVANPKQKHQLIIGDRGTDSELLHNHKALMWDNSRKFIGFPINITKISDEEKNGPNAAHAWGRTEFMGAHVYKVSLDKGFELVANPSHYDEQDLLKMGDYFPQDYAKNIQRILYLDDTFYTVSPSEVLATDILSRKDLKSVEFKIPKEVPVPYYPMPVEPMPMME